MWDNNEQTAWEDIKNTWNDSSHSKEIKIAMSQLVTELKNWTSPFEQDTIQSDIKLIKGAISQFEKESIKKDLIFIKRTTSRFEKNFIKSGLNLLTGGIKKFLAKIKFKKNKRM